MAKGKCHHALQVRTHFCRHWETRRGLGGRYGGVGKVLFSTPFSSFPDSSVKAKKPLKHLKENSALFPTDGILVSASVSQASLCGCWPSWPWEWVLSSAQVTRGAEGQEAHAAFQNVKWSVQLCPWISETASLLWGWHPRLSLDCFGSTVLLTSLFLQPGSQLLMEAAYLAQK